MQVFSEKIPINKAFTTKKPVKALFDGLSRHIEYSMFAIREVACVRDLLWQLVQHFSFQIYHKRVSFRPKRSGVEKSCRYDTP